MPTAHRDQPCRMVVRGPGSGQDGAAVIAGHVDSAEQGPLVFWRLRDLRSGDQILIRPASTTSSSTRLLHVNG
jgi:sortase (surface protein transpeptidase)